MFATVKGPEYIISVSAQLMEDGFQSDQLPLRNSLGFDTMADTLVIAESRTHRPRSAAP